MRDRARHAGQRAPEARRGERARHVLASCGSAEAVSRGYETDLAVNALLQAERSRGRGPRSGNPGRLRSVPACRHSPTLARLGDAEDLASGRGPVLLRRAEAEVLEDSPDGELIGHEGEDAHALAAARADERIHVVDLRDQPGPAC